MRKLLLLALFSFFSCHLYSQVTLTTSPYIEDFNGIGTALPAGFTIRTAATATVLGTTATLTTAATAWNNTTGAFKNFASASAGSTASTAVQSAATDRALGLRPTGTLGDPGGAFVFQLANTTGKTALRLSFDLQSLDATSPRTATWRVDYGFGASPTTFTAATATGTLTTGGSTFTNNSISVDFGTALDNNAGPIWIRIVTLAATTGSGNRPSSAIDNFNLTFTSSSGPATPTLVANPTTLAFGNQSVNVSSTSKTYTLTGTDLTSSVNISVPAPFSISKNNTTFSGAISYTAIEAAAAPTVYVQYTPTTTGASSANVLNTSTGATSVNVALTGTGVAGDVTAPANTATYPKTNNITITSFDLITNISEAGKSYYVIIPSTGTAPTTTAQVKAGQDGNGVAAFKSGVITNTANTDATANITGLTGNTTYNIYVVAEDNVLNLQATASTLNVTTANVPLVSSPIIISQYYEGASVNKWIELTNLSNAPLNTAALNLKLALYNISGDAGNINITGAPSQTVNLTVTIPARGTVIIGNTGNGNEVPYLTGTSAVQNSNTVVNFNGNDGVALLDANGNVMDAFGQGINAKDVSYVRSINVTAPTPTFDINEWQLQALAVVQNAIDGDDADQLGVHFPPNLPVCAGPTVSATALSFSNVTTGSITGTFNKSTDANEYLIIRSLNSTLSATPVDGTSYTIGAAFGGGIVANKIVSNTYTDNNLASSTNYYYFIFPLNNLSCTGGPKYLTTNVLTANQTTKTLLPCATPAAQPTNFVVTASNYNFVQGSFTASVADEYLVVMSTTNSLSASPVNATVYNVGDQIGGGIVVKRGVGNTFIRNGLSQNTTYYFFVYAVNSACSGGPLYLNTNPLKGSNKTGILDVNKLNWYYGNLHSHSSYSDGNKDDLTKKPEDDYAFAKNSMNLDFLGISEHNHTQAGMSLANWQPGITAAKNATTSSFVALHGMEWGVISGGGHVIVYGIDSLIGWESGENQIYVPKSVYTGPTGLFRVINRHGLNAIATLAHPNTTDYNNISATYDLAADSAIVGTALESGPAFSTNTTYSDPASSMSYMSYYNRMLAKGYHLGASIDHDNHNLTFGRHTRARLVVLAPALTENDLLDAIKKMRFYASQDSAAKITYTINKQPVGSIFTNAAGPEISITSKTTSPVTSIKLMYGTPGSGINPVEITNSTTGTLTFTHTGLANLATGYYYADIVETDGSRIITSPIWYTRDDAYVKKNQTITLAATKTVTYGDPDFPIGATSDNTEINMTYTSSDPTIATISNNDIHIIKAGTVTITANQIGNAFYNDATPKTQVLTIAPKAIAVTAAAKSKIQGATDPALTYSSTPALLGSDVFTGNITRVAGETPGDYNIGLGTLAINANYQINYTSAIFKIIPKPIGTISGTTAVCLNGSSPNITFNATVGTAPFTFTYNINGGANRTAVVTSPNTSVTVAAPTNIAGSFAYNLVDIADANTNQAITGTATITVRALATATITGTTAVPQNATAPSVTFTGANGTAPYTFTYNINGGTNKTVTTTSGNTVTVVAPTNVVGSFTYNLVSVADVNCGQAQTGTATVLIRPLPVATISATASVCINGPSPLMIFTGANGTAPYTFTYTINGGANRTITTNTSTASLNAPTNTVGTFLYALVSVADAYGSQAQTGYATVTVNALPVVSITKNSVSPVVSKGTPVILTATGGTNYSWSPSTDILNGQGTATLMVRPKQTTTYTVTVTNASGCTSNQSITVEVEEDYKIKPLNILTPNGDGKNDKFTIENIDYYPNNTLKIFDRSGRIVYTKKGYANEWDGTYNGTALASDTYYYVLDFGTNISPFKGYITIIRN